MAGSRAILLGLIDGTLRHGVAEAAHNGGRHSVAGVLTVASLVAAPLAGTAIAPLPARTAGLVHDWAACPWVCGAALRAAIGCIAAAAVMLLALVVMRFARRRTPGVLPSRLAGHLLYEGLTLSALASLITMGNRFLDAAPIFPLNLVLALVLLAFLLIEAAPIMLWVARCRYRGHDGAAKSVPSAALIVATVPSPLLSVLSVLPEALDPLAVVWCYVSDMTIAPAMSFGFIAFFVAPTLR